MMKEMLIAATAVIYGCHGPDENAPLRLDSNILAEIQAMHPTCEVDVYGGTHCGAQLRYYLTCATSDDGQLMSFIREERGEGVVLAFGGTAERWCTDAEAEEILSGPEWAGWWEPAGRPYVHGSTGNQ